MINSSKNAKQHANYLHHSTGRGLLLDTVVDPEYQRQGVGYNLVQTLIQRVRAAGCEWLHVDYEPHLDSFYRDACGFKTTQAGLLRLSR